MGATAKEIQEYDILLVKGASVGIKVTISSDCISLSNSIEPNLGRFSYIDDALNYVSGYDACMRHNFMK